MISAPFLLSVAMALEPSAAAPSSAIEAAATALAGRTLVIGGEVALDAAMRAHPSLR